MLQPQEGRASLPQNSEGVQSFSWSQGAESRGVKRLVLAEMLAQA